MSMMTAADVGVTEIKCWSVTPGTTGAGGWDLEVSLQFRGKLLTGSVTLLPAEYDGHPVAWGSPDNWLSSSVLWPLRSDLPGDAGIEDQHDFRCVLDEIEEAATAAVQASGVEPGEAYGDDK